MIIGSSGIINGGSSGNTGGGSIGMPSGAMGRGIVAGLSAGTETGFFSGGVDGIGASC